MKTFLLSYFFLMMLFASGLQATDDKVNVLGYYAVTNSLDGQPMIDMVNVLRFYPVFAMRDSVDKVNVTIYYGGNIFERDAERMDDGKYWQALLPIFHLGEAIQRMEVDVHFRLEKSMIVSYKKRLENVTFEVQNEKEKERQKFKISKKEFGDVIKDNNKEFSKMGLSSGQADQLRRKFETDDQYVAFRNSIISTSEDRDRADSLITIRSESREGYLNKYEINVKQKILLLELQRAQILDSVRSTIARLIEAGLTDTNYSGPSVRKSDIIISDDLDSARILYRNYKQALRRLVALDPAEHLGVFRVRYVPFPVTRLQGEDKPILHGPFNNNFTVFEVGLTFGDAIVPGDEFVVPEFSWSRLGVAFGITEKLFSDSAQVIALALTYDFNSYGSLGVGGNFAQHEVNPYFSFGINKKAFEAVLSGLAKLFK